MSVKKIALVTGGAGVMGMAVTRALVDDGTFVVIADYDQAALEASSDQLGSDQVLPLYMDVSKLPDVIKGVQHIQREVGVVTILVNNAGVFSASKAVETSEQEWRRVFSVNLDGAFFVAQAVLPGMRTAGWGRIINVSSYAAKSGGVTAGTAYAASKGGMISLTFSLAAETVKQGITVNGIAPAWVKTPMVTDLPEAEQARTISKIPVGRFCEPEEFAHIVRFLASDLSGFITGEVVDLNGGVHFD